ncbi:argininosuccinate lyase [Tissierella creatinini]|nr:argininosuccinate lyase [Tissierella creatinini]TJX64413.1 argininosuccinate lyase [Soehngenia saccharolytica]
MRKNYETKLWGGRFREGEDKLMEEFQNNYTETLWLLQSDIIGSKAHVKMLVKCEILTEEEGTTILKGLEAIEEDLKENKLDLDGDYEDVHTFVELDLLNRVGDVAKKLHTARSRNDQVNLDMKLYVREQLKAVMGSLNGLLSSLEQTADENPWLMPGYTHLQRAQVVTFKYHLMAYHSMFSRDLRRIQDAYKSLTESPLGCGALAGTTHEIDRQYTADLLGFDTVYSNFMDGVSDRDFILEALADFSILMMHLSRLSEELCLWTSAEFGFVTLDDRYTTGSSIMPQKKNPDAAELVRGKTGRVYGNLMGLLTVMKGLPLAYNKDMQEDKEYFYDSLNTTIQCIDIMERMISTLKARPENMKKAVKKGFLNATEVADYLVKKGMAFREAHSIVGQIVIYAEDNEKAIEELSLEELSKFSDVIDNEIYTYIDYENILNKGIKKEML